jgi:hypothetical protein
VPRCCSRVRVGRVRVAGGRHHGAAAPLLLQTRSGRSNTVAVTAAPPWFRYARLRIHTAAASGPMSRSINRSPGATRADRATRGQRLTASAEKMESLLFEELEHQYLSVHRGVDPGSTKSKRERKIQLLFTAAMTICKPQHQPPAR